MPFGLLVRLASHRLWWLRWGGGGSWGQASRPHLSEHCYLGSWRKTVGCMQGNCEGGSSETEGQLGGSR